jgi:N utilization substance protein B
MPNLTDPVQIPFIDDQLDTEESDPEESAPTLADPAHKSGMDPRHARRIAFMQNMFAFLFHQNPELKAQFEKDHPELVELINRLEEIDRELQNVAAERPLAQINKVDLAILRSIVFEWKTSQTPKKVLINEGVELAKEFGTESSPKFVNGVLAKLMMTETEAEPDTETKTE